MNKASPHHFHPSNYGNCNDSRPGKPRADLHVESPVLSDLVLMRQPARDLKDCHYPLTPCRKTTIALGTSLRASWAVSFALAPVASCASRFGHHCTTFASHQSNPCSTRVCNGDATPWHRRPPSRDPLTMPNKPACGRTFPPASVRTQPNAYIFYLRRNEPHGTIEARVLPVS